MINLLPPDLKSSYRYAHLNAKLLRWIGVFGLAIIGLVVISAGGLLYLYQTSRSYDTQISSLNRTLKEQNIDEVSKQTEHISNNLKLAVKVLSKEVLFSKLLTHLASITPSNANLTDLNISQEQTGIDITAETTDYNAATQLQVNLSDPNNKLFTKADIVSISCESNSDSGTSTKYPCSVVIRALFVKDNPFLFINNKDL